MTLVRMTEEEPFPRIFINEKRAVESHGNSNVGGDDAPLDGSSSRVDLDPQDTVEDGRKPVMGGRDPCPRAGRDLPGRVPDGGWGWMVVLGGFIISSLAGAAVQCFSLFFLEFRTRFQASTAATAWIYSLNMFICMASGPVTSVVCRKVTCRVASFTGGLTICLVYIISAFLSNLWSVYLVFGVIGGLAGGLIFLPPLIMINEYFDKKRGKAAAMSLLGRGIGALALSPVITYLFEEFGFQGGMIIFAGISLHVCVAGLLFRPNRNFREKPSNEGHGTSVTSQDAVENGFTKEEIFQKEATEFNGGDKPKSTVQMYIDMKQRTSPSIISRLNSTFHLNLLKNGSFCAFCLLIFTLSMSLSTVNVCIASIVQEMNFTSGQIALLISLMMGGVSLLSRPLSGIVLDLKVVRPHRKFILGGTSLAVSVTYLTAPSAGSTAAVFAVWVTSGFLASSFTTQEQIVLPDIVGVSRQPPALGLSAFFRGAGILIGPTLGGYLRDVTGSYHTTLYLNGTLVLLSSLIFQTILAYKRTKK